MKFSIRDSRLVSVGVASVIAVSVIGFGSAAFAQDSGTTPTPSAQTDGTAPKDCDGHGIGIGIRGLLKNTGLTAQEIADGKAAGLTWGQILDQYGDVTAAQAKQQALDTLKSKLDQAVANGKLTQEQADQRLADAGTKIDEFLNSQPGDLAEADGHGRGFKGFGSLETVAGVLGIDEATLRQRLAAGETLAQIAGDKTQAVIDALTAEVNAKIDEAVANGKLTADEAAAKKAEAAQRITTWVNEGGPLKGLGKGFGRGPKGAGAPMTPSSTLTPAQ